MASQDKKPIQTKDTAEKGTVRAVERAFRLLRNFGPRTKSLSLTEMARAADLPISTTSRLIMTLENEKFLRRQMNGNYVPGSRLLQAGISALNSIDLYEVSEESLQNLSRLTSETVNLAIETEDNTVIYLRQFVSTRPIRHESWVGRVIPILGTAIGAAIRNKTNADGYVWTDNTLEAEVTAIAAPVLAENGDVLAALSVTGPSYRFDQTLIESAGRNLVIEASSLAERLGRSFNE
jgi:urocanate hydratase